MESAAYPAYLRVAAAALLAAGVFSLLRGRGSVRLAAAPVVLPLTAAGWRTVQTGQLPLASLHETLITFACFLALAAAVACATRGSWRTYGLCLAGGAVLLCASSFAPLRPTPRVPALQTLWFQVHVSTSFLAYACFALSAAASTVLLLGVDQGGERRILERANLWGFAGFTWAMVSGGIWAYLAWGTYWLWHVKELWSGIVWTYYAGLVHLPHLAAWRGRRQALLSLAGFGLVLFTYLGVGLLMRNTHQF